MRNINSTELAYYIIIYTVLSTMILFLICKFLNNGKYRPVINNILLSVIFPPASPLYILYKTGEIIKMSKINKPKI